MWTVLLILCVLVLGSGVAIWGKAKRIEMAAHAQDQKFNSEIYEKRMAWLLGYFVIALLLLILACACKIFRPQVQNDPAGCRLLWCAGSSFLGAFLCGFRWRIRSQNEPLPAYLLYYPFVVAAYSALAVAITTIILELTKVDDDYIFYCLAFFIGVFLSQYLDNIDKIAEKVRGIVKN